jgi:hypothetical protein
LRDPAAAPDSPGPSSLADPKRGAELRFALVMLTCLIVIPIVSEKLFPFDRPSFFVASETQHASIELFDPRGAAISPHAAGLGDYYWAQNGYFSAAPGQELGAVRLPPTIHVHGDIPTRKEIREVVREAMVWSIFPYVTVRRTVKGAVDEARVGIVEQDTWRVWKPGGGRR